MDVNDMAFIFSEALRQTAADEVPRGPKKTLSRGFSETLGLLLLHRLGTWFSSSFADTHYVSCFITTIDMFARTVHPQECYFDPHVVFLSFPLHAPTVGSLQRLGCEILLLTGASELLCLLSVSCHDLSGSNP